MAIDWDAIEKKYNSSTPSAITTKPTTQKPIVPKPVSTKKKQNIFETTFDKDDPYWERFKRGDIGGGLANLGGATLQSAQSAYLNMLNMGQDLLAGNKPKVQYQMDYGDYEQAIGKRTGTQPLSEKIGEKNPFLGQAYRFGMEVLTDPIELTPFGFANDIKLAKGAGQGTAAYADSLRTGKAGFPYQPKQTKKQAKAQAQTTSQGVQTPAQRVSPQSNTNVPPVQNTPFTPPQIIPQINKPPKLKTNASGGNIDTARAKINYDGKTLRKKNLWEQIRTQVIDDLAPLEGAEIKVRGVVPSAEGSLYKQARLFKGLPEKANLVIDNELAPIIKSIEDSGGSHKDLGLYAEAVHARDVNKAGLKSGFTNAEIDDVIRTLGTPEMEKARRELIAYSNRRLQTLVDGGLITPDQVKAMNDKWANYMPLNRFFDDDKVEFAVGMSKAFDGAKSPIKALKGSERTIIDPIESLIRNTYKIELAAGRNTVGRQLIGLAADDTTSSVVRRLTKGEDVGRKNVVRIMENGQEVAFEVTPEVYKALKGLNKEATNMLVKVFQAPASVLRAGAVLTPEFAIRNPMRDIMQAYINSGSGFNPITDFTAGLASYIGKGDLYKQFLQNNAGYGNIISMDRKLHKNALQKMLKKSTGQKIINVVNPQSWLRVLRNISDATESATKIGEFRAALRSGATPQEAAYRARDMMDFARAGSSIREVNKVVAFLNANIQGKSKLIRSIKRDPLGTSTRLVASMAVPSVGAYASNHLLANEEQRQKIKDAPTWLKDSFWLIAIPGTDQIARIPKPFEGAAVSTVIERFLDYFADNDPEGFDGMIGDIIAQQSIPVMLTGITPIVEGMANYSFFRQAPIIPQREQYLQRKDQQDIYTSEVAKVLAGGVGKVFGEETNFASPRIMDNTLKGFSAGLGTYATDAVDVIVGVNRPAKNLSQQPVLKAFLVNETSSGKSTEFIYSEADRLTKEKNSNKDTFKEDGKLKYLEGVKKQMSDYSKEIREIQNSESLSPEAKRVKIKALYDKRNQLARDAYAKYKIGDNFPMPTKSTQKSKSVF